MGMAKALHLARRKRRSAPNPSLHHFFSTSSNDDSNNHNTSTNNSLSVSAYFTDVKASLKQPQPQPQPQPQQQPQQQQQYQLPRFRNPSNPSTSTFKPIISNLQEIRKNLSDFRRLSAVPPPTQSSSPIPSQSPSHVSFRDIYKHNVPAKQGESNENPNGSGPGANSNFDVIRNSLRKIKKNPVGNIFEKPYVPFPQYRESLRSKSSGGNVGSQVIGGSLDELPKSIFGREMNDASKKGDGAMKTDIVTMYGYVELGQKLKQLRPEKKGEEGWFSLQELSERLTKLREIDEKETETRIGRVFQKAIRDGLQNMKTFKEEEKTEKHKSANYQFDFFGNLGKTPEHMLRPPKENLVEKYLHPDNMSSAEKMKIDLAKVREEFKMSESDCGSARVQVAQLTTKIKHLSSVLHKKDKHSRKGLQAMVQKRKKLLKYLRRTDWDSYCLVLSKLGLRDNPDYGEKKRKQVEK